MVEIELMSDFEMLSIVLMILGIVVTILIAYIDHMKKYLNCIHRSHEKVTAPRQRIAVTFRN